MQTGNISRVAAFALMFLCTGHPAMGNEANEQITDSSAYCKAAAKAFLESDFPSSADAERYFDCYRVDFTYGSITRVTNPELPKHHHHCHLEDQGIATDCAGLFRG